MPDASDPFSPEVGPFDWFSVTRHSSKSRFANADPFLDQPPQPSKPHESPPSRSLIATKSKVFVVHGHNRSIKTEVENFVLRSNRDPVVLSDRSQPGENLIDELHQKSKDVKLAIVVATADDVGRGTNEPESVLHYRMRQNVMFEFGYFINKLGKGMVFVLHEMGVEIPSDYNGVIYIPYDENGAWKVKLAKAMTLVGYSTKIEDVS